VFIPESSHDVTVTFQGQMFGSFRQSVIFDFGAGLLLHKRLVVDVGNLDWYNEISAERVKMPVSQWTDKSADVVYLTTSTVRLAKYSIPDTDELAYLSSMEHGSLTEGNYVHQMHRMLHLEELARTKLVSRYNDRCGF